MHTSPDRIAQIIDDQPDRAAAADPARSSGGRMARAAAGGSSTITSICAQRGFPGLVAYAATKGGMDAATRTLARELRGRVLVNCVAPGFFASEMSSVLGTERFDDHPPYALGPDGHAGQHRSGGPHAAVRGHQHQRPGHRAGRCRLDLTPPGRGDPRLRLNGDMSHPGSSDSCTSVPAPALRGKPGTNAQEVA